MGHRSGRLNIISKDLRISANDPWVSRYDCVSHSQQERSEAKGWDTYVLWDDATINLNPPLWSNTRKTYPNWRMQAETLV